MAVFSNDDPSFFDWVGNGLNAATVCYGFEHYKPSYTVVSPLSPYIPDDELMGIISEMKGLPGFHSCGELTGHSTWAATLDATSGSLMTTMVTDEEVPSRIYSPSIIVDHTQIPSLAYSESASIVSMEEMTDLPLPACIPDSRTKELKRLMERSHYVQKISRPRDEPSGSSNDLSYPNVDGKVYDDKVDASHAQKLKRKNRPNVHDSAQNEPVKDKKSKRSRSTRVSKGCPGDSNSKINVTKNIEAEGESPTKIAKEEPKTEPPKDYIHVRARRGEATDSHSLAERVRREKIRERMQRLQELVPGCSKVTGKAHMLDEIINYVQSLQSQVEFLSAKLASVTPLCKFHLEINDILNEEFHTAWPSQATPDPVAMYAAGINCIQETEPAASAASFQSFSTREMSSSTYREEDQLTFGTFWNIL